MKKMFKGIVLAGFAALIMTVAPVFAAGPYGISFSGAVAPFIGGDAGSGIGAPGYDDAFSAGWGVRLEPYYDFNQQLRAVLGLTIQRWSGDTFSGVEFDDLNLWSIYAGVKYRFLPGSAVRPYVLADLGYARLDSVDIRIGSASGTYWDSTDTFLLDFGGGAEFVVAPNLSLFIDIRAQVFGEPDSALASFSDADGGLSVPVSVGLNLSW